MVDWAKKITKSVGDDIRPDEQVEAGLFVQPGGMTGALMGRELGGIVGHVTAVRSQSKKEANQGIVRYDGVAASIPNANTVIGLTAGRMLFWKHGKMSGKPKELIAEVPLSEIAALDMEKGKLTHALVIRFADGSAVAFEAPRIGRPDTFREAFSRLTG